MVMLKRTRLEVDDCCYNEDDGPIEYDRGGGALRGRA